MAIREFVDDRHVEWKVWCVTPEQMRPVHAREMFHGRYVDYQEGWLVFESAAERRRLAPFPGKWAELSDEELQTLLRGAQVVPTRLADERQSGIYPRYVEETARAQPRPASPTPAAPEPAPAGDRATTVLRRFLDAGGRTWTVTLVERAAAGVAPVLRFTANDGTAVDVESFPDDWSRLPRERLCELMVGSLARASTASAPSRSRPDEMRR